MQSTRLPSSLPMVILAFAALPAFAQVGPSRPNIVFLLTDDQRWNTLGSMGNPIIRTPVIDELSRNGVTFANAFATTAICFASRASIFSGQHFSRHGLQEFSSVFTEAAWQQTYPALLRRAGYHTGFVGKWGLGNPLPVESFDRWYGFAGQGNYEIMKNGVVVQHLTALMGDQALRFLDSTSRSKPFCLSLSFKAPHIQDGDPRQFIPDSADMGLYADDVFPPPPNADPAFFASLPAFLRDSASELRKRWVLEYSTPARYQESMRNYYRLISGVDRVVGRIRMKLAEIGAADNTVIVFTSDHGLFTGDRGYAGKWLAYQASIRIPLIVFDPRFSPEQKGRRIQEMVLNLDLPQTLLSLAGVAAPAAMQGRDLLTLIKGTARDWRSEFFYDHTWSGGRIPPSQAVVGKRYKYIVYTDQNPPYEELYDLATDPDEAKNLIASAAYQRVLDSLKIRFQILKQSVAAENEVREVRIPISHSNRLAGDWERRPEVGSGARSAHPPYGGGYLPGPAGDWFDGIGRSLAPRLQEVPAGKK